MSPESGFSPELPTKTSRLLRFLGIGAERFSAADVIREGVPVAVAVVTATAAEIMMMDSMKEVPAIGKAVPSMLALLGTGFITYSALRHTGDFLQEAGDILAVMVRPVGLVACISGGALGLYSFIDNNPPAAIIGFGLGAVGIALSFVPQRD